MTTHPPSDDFPRYTGQPDEETVEVGPPQQAPGPSGVPRRSGPMPPQNGNGTNVVAATAARTQDWWQEKLHKLSLHARVTLLAAVAVGLAVAIVSISAYGLSMSRRMGQDSPPSDLNSTMSRKVGPPG